VQMFTLSLGRKHAVYRSNNNQNMLSYVLS
jgi:hypothetical protein